MKLSQAAGFFDRSQVRDGYSGAKLFLAQLDLFDDSVRDAIGAERRILSAQAGSYTKVPTHRCITVGGTHYIVGDRRADEFNGATLREKYVMQEAPFVLAAQSAAAFLQGSVAPQQRAGGVWVKDLKLETASSDMRDMYAFYVAPSSSLAIDTFIRLDNLFYRVRASYWTAGGFKAVEANLLRPDTFGTITFTPRSSAYNAALNEFATVDPVEAPAFVLHWHDDYTVINTALASWRSGYDPGDVRIRVHPEDVPTIQAEDTFSRGGQVWSVISAYLAEDGSWSVHGRPQ